jgi:hypothetical protein
MAWKDCRTIHPISKRTMKRRETVAYAMMKMASSAALPVKLYNVNLQFDPAIPEARKPTKLVLTVAEQTTGEPTKLFEKIHDKLMWLIIVNTSDLSIFAHIHTSFPNQEGKFEIIHTFPEADNTRYVGRGQTRRRMTDIIAAFRFKMSGHALDLPAKASHGREEQDFSKVLENGSYRIDLMVPDHIAAGQNTDIILE